MEPAFPGTSQKGVAGLFGGWPTTHRQKFQDAQAAAALMRSGDDVHLLSNQNKVSWLRH